MICELRNLNESLSESLGGRALQAEGAVGSKSLWCAAGVVGVSQEYGGSVESARKWSVRQAEQDYIDLR